LTTYPNPMSAMPGFEAMQRQQQAFLKTLMRGWAPPSTKEEEPASTSSELADIKRQLAELQERLSGRK